MRQWVTLARLSIVHSCRRAAPFFEEWERAPFMTWRAERESLQNRALNAEEIAYTYN